MKTPEILNELLKKFIDFSPKLILALLVLLIGFWIIKRIIRQFEKAIDNSNSSPEVKPFLKSLVNIILKILIVFSAASIIGIETSSFVAIIAAMGFAIGMALQGSLGNLASGIMILTFKPYKVGDVVDIKGYKGTVERIDIFNSIIIGYDNREIIIPNGVAISDVIVNMTSRKTRRIDINLTMPYQESFPKVKEVILEGIKPIPNILETPAPNVVIQSFDSHNISIQVRMHSEAEFHWAIHFEAMERIKASLSRHQIPIAVPEGVELYDIGE